MTNNYLKDVREQYENYPFPYRDPNDEYTRLRVTYEDQLGLLSHYGFNGKIPLSKEGDEFRVLVAGGGTGDAVIHLAFQLQGLSAKVVYLDISTASMKIAKKRAKIRGLDNIEFIHASILDLPKINLKPFHYINCSGVLHHLDSPTDGLNSLKSVLRDDGVMGIMVYGKYGRTGIYQMQDLMRMINKNEENLQVKVNNTRDILNILPATNWFKKDTNRWDGNEKIFTDISIYDLFLHSQDRCYDVKELYHWIENECSLNIVEFIGDGLTGKVGYLPNMFIKNNEILQKIFMMDKIEQQSIAELISGSLRKHTFYVSNKKDTIASLDNLDLIPYLSISLLFNYEEFSKALKENPDKMLKIDNQGIQVIIKATENLSNIFLKMNGTNSLREIFDSISVDNSILLEEFKVVYNKLFLSNGILLKDKKSSNILDKITMNIKEELLKEIKLKQNAQKIHLSKPTKV